jgi:hypothetical protein
MRRALFLTFLTAGLGAVLDASSLTCQLTGPSGNIESTACTTQDQILSNNPVNWLTAFGEATSNPMPGPLNTSNSAENITLTSPGLLQRADNTVFAWDSATSSWTFPDFIANENITTYQGQFDAPSTPTSCPPGAPAGSCNPWFGDDLLGVVGSNPLNIAFSSPVTSAGFLISSRSLANFQGTLQAYDSSNNLLGTYSIVANGLGGVCAGLGTLSPNPTPCNDAPLVAFLGSNSSSPQISKLIVTTSQIGGGFDSNGFFIDTLFVEDGAAVPEPSIILMFGSGLCAIGLLRRKRSKPGRS